MAFNFNNQRMGFGNNNTGNQFSKPNFGARSIDDIKEEMNSSIESLFIVNLLRKKKHLK